jgi:predicted nucleic acid-binding protein
VTRFTIDAPTLLRLVGDEVAVAADHQLVAPNAVRTHAVNLLLQRVRAGELTDQGARRLHTRLTETRIRVLSDRVSRWTAFQIAREHGWETSYAAEYLAVTRLQADALVTVDEELARLAEGLVPLAAFVDLTEPGR